MIGVFHLRELLCQFGCKKSEGYFTSFLLTRDDNGIAENKGQNANCFICCYTPNAASMVQSISDPISLDCALCVGGFASFKLIGK